MALIYRSQRIGKDGRPFSLYKFTTLKPTRKSFAEPEEYTQFGRFLRRTKIDELPQLVNWLKGDMNLFGPRPDFQETWDITPEHIKRKILSVKPGLLSLASLYFHDEERLLNEQPDKFKNYYTIIKPMKFHMDMFWLEYRCLLLNLALVWIAVKILARSLFKK